VTADEGAAVFNYSPAMRISLRQIAFLIANAKLFKVTICDLEPPNPLIRQIPKSDIRMVLTP